jgi:DNA-binding transcriptional MocR family regulator
MKRSDDQNLNKPNLRPFAFRLDAHSGVPVYRQLIDQVQAAIASGALLPEAQLPTVRQVAVDLAINPNTVPARIGRWRFADCSTRSRAQARSSPTAGSSIPKDERERHSEPTDR